MPLQYPLGLGTIVVSAKSRSQNAKFGMVNPKRGPGYKQLTGSDVPVFWTAQFKFTKSEAKRFWLWFSHKDYLNGGVNDFILPIGTEFGLVDHVCSFLPDSLMDTSQDGAVFTYSATITARKLIIPQESLDMASYIVEDFMNPNDWALIDLAMNEVWP